MIKPIKIYGVIYKLTNLINNKIYIGKTVDFTKRINSHKSRTSHQSKRYNMPITRAIEKYGFDSFKVEIVDIANTEKELNQKELFYIDDLVSHDPKIGYNSSHSSGGLVKLNSKTRSLMSSAHKGLKEKPSTKKKKSKKVIAYKDSKWVISDSGKLFADYIGVSKDMVSHAITKRMKIRDWCGFREELNPEDYLKCKDRNYHVLALEVEKGVETSSDITYIEYERTT